MKGIKAWWAKQDPGRKHLIIALAVGGALGFYFLRRNSSGANTNPGYQYVSGPTITYDRWHNSIKNASAGQMHRRYEQGFWDGIIKTFQTRIARIRAEEGKARRTHNNKWLHELQARMGQQQKGLGWAKRNKARWK